MSELKPLGPRKIKQLEKEIVSSYILHMYNVQVNMRNLSKVKAHVLNAVVNEGKTIEQGYAEARDLYREN